MPRKISLDEVLKKQSGVITRSQALAAGFTQAMIRSNLARGRWQRLFDGVYLVSMAPPSFRQRAWAGVLAAGAGAVASHSTAGVLLNVLPPNEDPITVSVVPTRNPRRREGLIVRRRLNIQPLGRSNPPHTTAVQTTLDLVADAREAADVVSTVIRCMGGSRIRPDEIRIALQGLPMQPSRALLLEMVSSVESGVRSPLEHRYRRDVEQGHDLPRPTRQSSRRGPDGRYVRDLDYEEWRLIVELDGRLNHESTDRVFRDMDRDNVAVLSGAATLRYGWLAVAGHPCRVAGQVASALRSRGWMGQPRRCGSACTMTLG